MVDRADNELEQLGELLKEVQKQLQEAQEQIAAAQGMLSDRLNAELRIAGAPNDGGEVINDRVDIFVNPVAAMRHPIQQPTSFPHYELVIDVQSRSARVGRRKVPLTDTEYQILELLWCQRPKSVSRRVILDRLYFGKHEPAERTIDVFISHIRQKLKLASGGFEFLEVVRGQGWMLKPYDEPDQELRAA